MEPAKEKPDADCGKPIERRDSLVENWEGEFGDEAINTIVQEMENNREDTIVIFAGYPEKMEQYFTRNPGLRSRVPFTICNEATKHPDNGNGRFCRNLVESAILRYAARVYGNEESVFAREFTLMDIDFTLPESIRKNSKSRQIGFAQNDDVELTDNGQCRRSSTKNGRNTL